MRRREVLALGVAAGALLASPARAADLGTFKVGVLKFGSVSWQLDAALNYWQFCAQLEAQGFRRLVEGTAIQEHFGVPARTPQLGYVLKESLGGSKPDLVQAFARALRAADGILKTSDEEWQRLKPLVRA